jgi:hypothetical protein
MKGKPNQHAWIVIQVFGRDAIPSIKWILTIVLSGFFGWLLNVMLGG